MNSLPAMSDHPRDPATGLTLPLSRSLDLQGLARHRAMVAIELEVMAKKLDRFGWERDRGTVAHDRIVSDWMDALHDYPLGEIQEACRALIVDNPRRMPNEGDVIAKIREARRRFLANRPRAPEPERQVPRVTKEQAESILASAGFNVRRIPE